MTSNRGVLWNGLDPPTVVEKKGFQVTPLSLSSHIGAIYTNSLKYGLNGPFYTIFR